MYTLIVVDMQPGFRSASGTRVRENCLREVNKAVVDGADIIFLEYEGYEATFKELTEAALHSKYIGSKCTDDGSSVVAKFVHRNQLFKNFKVCGINTDCCVKATVEGLTSHFPMSRIDVVGDACDSDWNHFNGLEAMKKLSGVVVQ